MRSSQCTSTMYMPISHLHLDTRFSATGAAAALFWHIAHTHAAPLTDQVEQCEHVSVMPLYMMSFQKLRVSQGAV